jgi:hypothetical protein
MRTQLAVLLTHTGNKFTYTLLGSVYHIEIERKFNLIHDVYDYELSYCRLLARFGCK